jgi:hypothetical protein
MEVHCIYTYEGSIRESMNTVRKREGRGKAEMEI